MEKDALLKEYPTAYQHPNDPMAEQLERLAGHFEDVAKSWGKVVYPALFAFILLAAYGFYLIYSLTTDVRKVADTMSVISGSFGSENSHMKEMNENIGLLSNDVGKMRFAINTMSNNFTGVTQDVSKITKYVSDMNTSIKEVNANMGEMTAQMSTLTPMLEVMNNMDYSSQRMADSTNFMGRQIGNMNDDMSPGGMMSRFMPF